MSKLILPTCLICFLMLSVGCKGPVNKQPETGIQQTNQQMKENMITTRPDEQITEVNTPKVVINGITWDKKTETEFEKIYNMKSIPGNYWYDAISGLWGNMGGQALGFIYPGHSYGSLSANVSNGNTGIFINGRHIPMSEALVWSQVMGTQAQPGRYWLDGRGNVGYEGNPYALFNLYMLGNQNNYSGKGGGDNFWSSRFARGNSTDDNSFGYVSIPGSGITVTYGD